MAYPGGVSRVRKWGENMHARARHAVLITDVLNLQTNAQDSTTVGQRARRMMEVVFEDVPYYPGLDM